jgi:hypothetical protein
MSRAAALLVLLTLLAVGCTPSLSPSEAKGVFAQGSQLLSDHPGGSIDKADWPTAISALNPKSLYAAPEGLYICTSRFFFEERGFFVPRPSTTVAATHSTDPSFKPLAAGLFTYLIKG